MMLIARPLPTILNALRAGRSRADQISSATSSSSIWRGSPISVWAHRIFLRRSRFKAWKATIQPHRCPEGYVGNDREGTTGKLISRTTLYCCTYKHLGGILAFTQHDDVALAQ